MSGLHRISTVTASTVTPQNARWAWDGRVPLGAVTVVAGPPGQGKTQLLVGACARVTRGQLAGDLHGAPADALFVSAEDSVEHTLTPRAIAANADLTRLHFLDAVTDHNGDNGAFLIPDHLRLLADWLGEQQVRLIVLDPIVAMLPTALNAHRDQHVRRALAPLARLADEHQVAVVVVMHLNKNTEGGDALNRLSGSIGFGGAARSVLLFTLDPDDPEGETGSRRVLAHVKCNVGPRRRSVAYRIEGRTLDTPTGQVETSIAIRDGHAAASAGDLLSAPTSAGEANARTEAREFLLAELAGGPAATRDLKQRAEDAGVAWRTVERAKQQIGVRARKRNDGWAWELPTPTDTPYGGVDGLGGLESNSANPAKAATQTDQTVINTETAA